MRPLDLSAHVLHVSLKDAQDLLDHASVGVLRLQPHARRLATADVVVEARPAGGLVRQVVAAGAHAMEPFHDLQRPPHVADRRIRPEIAGTVVHDPAGHPRARETFLHRDLDVRISLVVPQLDVEARTVLLD